MSLIQYRYFLFTLLLLNSPFAFSQKHKEPTLSQKKGLIIFEGNKDLYDIYFIKTDKHNLASLFSFSDTIYASTIQPPFEGHLCPSGVFISIKYSK